MRSRPPPAPENAGDFLRHELSKQFHAYVFPNKRFKSTAISLFLHRPLGPEATKLALLEPVLGRGCEGFPTLRTISTFCESLYGASFDTDVLKVGERQILGLSFRALNDRFAPRPVRSLQRSLEFLKRMVSGRRGGFRADYVAQEKTNLKRYLEGLINDRMGYALHRMTLQMCQGEPYGIHEYGSMEEVDSLDPRTLDEFHRRILRTSPVDLFVVGDLDPTVAFRAISKEFAPLLDGSVEVPPDAVSAPARPPREFRETLPVDQAKLILGFRTQRTLADPLFPALVFFNGILGAFPHSRLFSDLREQKGLCYQVHSFLEATKGLLFVAMGIDAANFAKARDLVLEHVRSLQSGRIEEDEFDKTKRLLATAVRGRDDSPGAKIHAALEGLVNGRILATRQTLERLAAVTKDRIAEASSGVRLDAVYLLTNPPAAVSNEPR